jgi:hypothetical protein
MQERSATLAQYAGVAVQQVLHNAMDVLNDMQEIDKQMADRAQHGDSSDQVHFARGVI